MKDIDFDELDKAVSSILGPLQKGSSSESDEPKTVAVKKDIKDQKSVDTESKPDDAPLVGVGVKTDDTTVVADVPEESKTKEAVVAPKPTASITPRRSGRFMDMVHPDSVVKEKPEAFAPKSGRTLQPSSSATSPAAGSSFDIQPPKSDPEKNDPAADSGEEMSHATLPVGSSNDPNVSSESSINTAGLDMKPFKDWDMDGTSDVTIDEKGTSTQTTPFLSETKVEKRPLGAFSDQVKTTADTTFGSESHYEGNDTTVAKDTPKQDDTQSADNEDNQFHATRLVEDDEEDREEHTDTDASTSESSGASAPAEHLPPELGKDVIAVESDGETKAHEDFVKREHSEPKKPGHGNLIASADSMVTAASAMAIPRQYKEGAKASDTGHSSLFDTDEYHPPLTKYTESHNHKHTVLWVIVALLLLIATAAGFGYWLYMQI